MPLVWPKSRNFPFSPWSSNHTVHPHKVMWTFWFIALLFPFLSFITRFSHVILLLKQPNYSRFDIFLRHFLYRFHLDGSYMTIHWREPYQTLAQTKPWPAAHEGDEVKTQAVHKPFGCHNSILGDVLSVAESRCTLSSCLNNLWTQWWHSWMTFPCALDWMNCTGRWECVKKL